MRLYDLTCIAQGYCQTKKAVTRNNIKVFKHQAATAVHIKGLDEYLVKVNGEVKVTNKDVSEPTEFLTCQNIFEYVLTFILNTMTEENKRTFIDFSQNEKKFMTYYIARNSVVVPQQFINDIKVLQENSFNEDTLVFNDYDKQFLQGKNLFEVVKQGKQVTKVRFKKIGTLTVDGVNYDFYYNTEVFCRKNTPTMLNYIYLRDILMRILLFLYPKKVNIDKNNLYQRGLSSYALYDIGRDKDASKLCGILNRVTLVTPNIKKVDITTNTDDYKYYYQVI